MSNNKVALLFCAYNEENALSQKLANLKIIKDKHPDIEIFAYSDCSTDATDKMLNDAEDLLTFTRGKKRMGKVMGMQKLVSMTDADILIFTDANVMIEPDSVSKLLHYFSCPDIGAVACTLIYKSPTENFTTATSEVNSLYWKLEEHIKKLESETGSTMGADGAFFARRSIGYPNLAADLVDDMAASISVIFDNMQMRCISAPDVIAYEHSISDSDEEFQRKKRIACGSYSTYRFLKPEISRLPFKDKFKFYSHKVMRWWGAAYLLVALVCLFASISMFGYGLTFLSFLLVALPTFWVLAKAKIPFFSSIYEILRAVFATGIGVVESLCGKKYHTWEPADSRN